MVGLFGRVVGGALAGLGTGLVEDAKMDGLMMREQRLAEIRHGYSMEELGKRNEYEVARDERQHGYKVAEQQASSGATAANIRLQDELTRRREGEWSVVTDPETGETYRENSKTKDRVPFTTDLKRAQLDGNGLTLNERRELQSLEKAFDMKTPEGKAAFREAARKSSSEAIRGLFGGEDPPTLSDEEDTVVKGIAGKRADKAASDRASWFRTDATDFADYGGSRELFTAEMKAKFTEEERARLLAEKRGKPAPKGDAPAAAEPRNAPPSAGAPTEAAAPPLDRLAPGKVTTFKNGQRWTIVNGKPQQVN